MNKSRFNTLGVWIVFGSAIAMLILVAVYQMAYLSAFGIDGTLHVCLSELLTGMIEPWIIVVAVMMAGVFLNIWVNNISISSDYYYNRKSDQELPYLSRKVNEFNNRIRNSKWAKNTIEDKEKAVGKRAKLESMGHHSLFTFFLISILLFILYMGVLRQQGRGQETGLNMAMMLILIPMILYVMLALSGKLFDAMIGRRVKTTEENNSYSFIDMAKYAFPFMVYAIAVCHICGVRQGEYIKTHSQNVFEIQTSHGEVYTDSTCCYVGQSHHEVILYDKKDNKSIILNKASLDKIQIDTELTEKEALLNFLINKIK